MSAMVGRDLATGAPRLALIGMGRMGRALDVLAAERGVPVVARLDRECDIEPATLQGAEVAIEFTEPAAALGNVRACLAAGCPVVVGTTGWYDALPTMVAEVERAGGRVLWAANYSLGVNALLALVPQAVALLEAAGFAAHLVETHHAAKKDAPSGTALAIAAAAGSRDGRELPITAVRVGHVPGTHELLFDAPFEQVRLAHEARDRRVFAEGALAAARWLAVRSAPGLYTMQDVLASAGTGERR